MRASDRFALVTLYLVWGSTFFAIHLAVAEIPPFLMGGVRFTLAGGGLYLWLRARGAQAPRLSAWLSGAVVGGLALTAANGLLSVAELSAPTSLCAILFSTQPLWAVLAAGLFGRWPSRRAWLGLAAGAAGVALTQGGSSSAGLGPAACVVFAAVAMGLSVVLNKRLPVAQGAMGSATQLLAGGVLMLAISAVKGDVLPALPHAPALLGLGYLIVFGSLVGYRAFTHVSTRLPPAMATSYAFVNPVVAALLGVGLAHERLAPTAVLGFLSVLVALALVLRPGVPNRSRSLSSVDAGTLTQ